MRARVTRVRSTVNSTAIASLFEPGGEVWANTRVFIAEAGVVARAQAPKRTGELAASVGTVMTPAPRNHCRGTVYADAPHARYVIEGTRPVIVGNMKIRLAPHSWFTVPNSSRGEPGVLMRQVSGQRANNFLADAISTTMRRWGML